METHRLKPVLLEAAPLKNMSDSTNNLNDMAILNGDADAPNDGFVAPLDGEATQSVAAALRGPLGIDGKPAATVREALAKASLGPNNERLEDLRPDLVNALRELEVQYRARGNGRAAERDPAHPAGAPVLAGLAVRVVESAGHDLESAVRVEDVR